MVSSGGNWVCVCVCVCFPTHTCTTDGVNYSMCNKGNDKVCVSVSVCLFSKMFDPSCSIETHKPVYLHPPTHRKINLENQENLSTSSRAFSFSTDPCRSGPGSIRTSSSLHSSSRSTCPKSQPLPLTACDGAENIFPSLWLWQISQRINHATKESCLGIQQRRKKNVW